MKEKITRKSIIKKSIIRDDVYWMIRHSLFSFLFMGVILWFMLFFLNMLVWLSNHAMDFSDTVRDKLSMFFYVKDIPGEEQNVYTKVLSLQQTLEKAGVETTFVSDKAGEQFLKNRVPDLFEKLEYYGIDSPFLATLYIKIPDAQAYEKVKSIVPEYSDIMFNVWDLTQSRTLQEQEKRIVRTVNFTSWVMVVSYSLIFVFLAMIVVIMIYMIKTKFQQYHDKIEIKKMLGASYLQIKLPFLILSSLQLLIGFWLMLLLMVILNIYVYQYDISIQYFAQLFNLDLAADDIIIKKYIWPNFWLLLIEMIAFVAILRFCSSLYLNRLIKKVHLN